MKTRFAPRLALWLILVAVLLSLSCGPSEDLEPRPDQVRCKGDNELYSYVLRSERIYRCQTPEGVADGSYAVFRRSEEAL